MATNEQQALWEELQARLAKLLQAAHYHLDQHNNRVGDTDELCLLCGAMTYDVEGIVHYPECLILEIRAALKEIKPNPTDERLAKLEAALTTIANHDGGRWLVDADGLQTQPQPSPQEIARAALGVSHE